LSTKYRSSRRHVAHVEPLEPRALLAGTPLPELADLENQTRPVVRFETNFGDVDIELFNDIVPNTVSNFLNYVRTGRYDQTFFHRMTRDVGSSIEVLQGGGFAYHDLGAGTQVPTDNPINLEFVQNRRSNTQGTIAMARTNNPNSATSQFFFNLNDNTNLDSSGPTNGFVVFGRVIQGFDVLQQIQTFQVRDVENDPAFSGPLEGLGGEVPTTSSYNATQGVRESSLVSITNAEEIKPQGFGGFFAQQIVSPEGFRSGTNQEILELYNPNGVAARYKVVARHELAGSENNFENGARDQTIAEGTINANTKLRITVSGSGAGGAALVRLNSGYALIVESALPEGTANPLALAGSFLRQDHGSWTTTALLDPSQYAAADMRDWTFARIDRNQSSIEFLSLYNTADEPANVLIDFLTPDGVQTVAKYLAPYQRGGLAVHEQPFSEGILGARVRSNNPVLVTLSDWTISGPTRPGVSMQGAPGGGGIAGAIALATRNETTGLSEVTLYNGSSNSTTVTLTGWRSDGTSSNRSVLLLANSVVTSNVDFGLSTGDIVAITYTSGTVPVTAAYTHVRPNGDVQGEQFRNRLPALAVFAEGANEPDSTAAPIGTVQERVSIFNPFEASPLDYTVNYVFGDGTVIAGATGTLAARNRVNVLTTDLSAVMAKIGSGTQFRHYAIVVSGSANAGGALNTPGVVAYERIDNRPALAIMNVGAGPLTSRLLSEAAFDFGGNLGG